MSTATRTVVFTDLANYTAKVSRSDREGLRRILAEHEALVHPIVEHYQGRIVKNLGDSFLILFPSATDALRGALDVQKIVTETAGMGIRLALNTGDVEEIDGDAFGECVNLAARILSKTPAGDIWFGLGTWVCMNAAEIPWESVGQFRLKGIASEQRVFRAVTPFRAWLPEPIQTAIKAGTLVRLRRGAAVPKLPSKPVLLFEGFTPGSADLSAAIDALPVLNPASLWLSSYRMAPIDRHAWTSSGRGLVVGTSKAIDQAIQDVRLQTVSAGGSDTIIFEIGGKNDLELVSAGLALPAVPLSDVVASYFYDLLPDGRWVNGSDRAMLRVEVDGRGARIIARSPGIHINGRTLATSKQQLLRDGDSIGTPKGVHRFVTGGHGYCGLVLADTDMRLGVAVGQLAEIGREPNHPGLAFPDRRGQENIRWCPGPRAARARAGGFTLDRALAGRRQAAIEVTDPTSANLTPLHPRCPTYVLEHGRSELTRVENTRQVAFGTAVVAGTMVIRLCEPH